MFDQEGRMIARLDASISIKFSKNTALIREQVLQEEQKQRLMRSALRKQQPMIGERQMKMKKTVKFLDQSQNQNQISEQNAPKTRLQEIGEEQNRIQQEDDEMIPMRDVPHEQQPLPIQPVSVESRPRKAGKTFEDIVNANYCPPVMWLQNKEAPDMTAPQLNNIVERQFKSVKNQRLSKRQPKAQESKIIQSQVQDPLESQIGRSNQQPGGHRVETLLLQLLLMMRRGQIPVSQNQQNAQQLWSNVLAALPAPIKFQ